MSKHPKALELAEFLEFCSRLSPTSPNGKAAQAAAELRRQHELIAELVEALRLMLEGTEKDRGCIRLPNDAAVQAAFKAIAKAEAA